MSGGHLGGVILARLWTLVFSVAVGVGENRIPTDWKVRGSNPNGGDIFYNVSDRL